MISIRKLSTNALGAFARYHQGKAKVAFADQNMHRDDGQKHAVYLEWAIESQKDQRESAANAREHLFELLRRQAKDAKSNA